MVLRLLEHYPSVQGEGPRVGTPTQFVRFAGCNLRCPKWPCDTPYAIEPKLYRAEQQEVSSGKLIDAVREMKAKTGASNVCLTGGEPMLQHNDSLDELVSALFDLGYTIEMFSNGTLKYTAAVCDSCDIVMDWKLPGSGEDSKDKQRIRNYIAITNYITNSIKFTVADQADLRAAMFLYRDHHMEDWEGHIYCGPVWIDTSHSLAGGTPVNALTAADIVKFILEHQLPWKLNLQIHKYVWPADARRT